MVDASWFVSNARFNSFQISSTLAWYNARILRTGFRLGDAAEMAIIELVDYNENMLKTPKAAAKKTTRRAGKKAAPKAEAPVEAPAQEAPAAEAVAE